MLECLILGDSIAVGTKMYMPQCADYAKGGINSWQFNKMYKGKELIANTVIISLGSNDHKYVKTYDELFAMRQRIDAKKMVYWILPAGNLKASEVPIENIQKIVTEIANYYRDMIIVIPETTSDNIHPTGRAYKIMSEEMK
jgi:lysophospholipase L1-like esterase